MSETPDDVDRLFARLERAAVPGDFAARVLATSRPTTRPVLAWPWLVALLARSVCSCWPVTSLA